MPYLTLVGVASVPVAVRPVRSGSLPGWVGAAPLLVWAVERTPDPAPPICCGFTEPRADRALAARQTIAHPVVLVDRVGQLAMLFLSHERIFDNRPVGALLVELARGLAQVRRVPEARPDLAALADDLLLLHEL